MDYLLLVMNDDDNNNDNDLILYSAFFCHRTLKALNNRTNHSLTQMLECHSDCVTTVTRKTGICGCVE